MTPLKYDYIVVEGNIGTGKTSLATRLAKEHGVKLVLERFAENPFLPLFYEQPGRFAFPLELSFLADRYSQLKDEISQPDLFRQQTVSDYMLSKSLIFAGITLQENEYELYERLFQIIHPHLPQPDLLVYLHKDVAVLQRNITLRGRSYEQKIEPAYLTKLEEAYWKYLKQQIHIPVVIINSDNIDFVNEQSDYDLLLDAINRKYTAGVHRINVK
jgi:deoxyadenosine/deoxycytidine kinase